MIHRVERCHFRPLSEMRLDYLDCTIPFNPIYTITVSAQISVAFDLWVESCDTYLGDIVVMDCSSCHARRILDTK